MDMIVAETLDLEKGGDVDSPVSLSPGSDRQVVPIGEGVAKSGVLTHVPRAFVVREICVFLATLAAAYPGCDSQRSAFGNDKSNEFPSKKTGATTKPSAVA
jgi:hypothetical protein